MTRPSFPHRSFRAYTSRDLESVPQFASLPAETLLDMKAVSSVLPFRVNNHVVEELIDWDRIPEDPMYQLTMPQPGMLEDSDLDRLRELHRSGADAETITSTARSIQRRLNPHPAGQVEMNVPLLDEEPVAGMQHKYRETVLFFPSQGQTCHAYCTYCFRWPQFVGLDELKFASREAETLARYLREHREVTDVLFTGGDPMIMKTRVLRRYIEPLLAEDLDHIQSIRIGTKAPAYWPYRFVTDQDSDDLLRLFEQVRAAGRQLAFMAHYSHPRELEPPVAREAVRRVLDTGAVIRCQAPMIRHVNDDAAAWADLWTEQVRLGMVPYYLFVERDTGAKRYFEVPLARALSIFTEAIQSVSGLGRTVRGPSMSATPGKVLVDGVAEIGGEKVFILKFLQGRNPKWAGRVFFARYDESATWLNELRPAFGAQRYFFAEELDRMQQQALDAHQAARGPQLRPPQELHQAV